MEKRDEQCLNILFFKGHSTFPLFPLFHLYPDPYLETKHEFLCAHGIRLFHFVTDGWTVRKLNGNSLSLRILTSLANFPPRYLHIHNYCGLFFSVDIQWSVVYLLLMVHSISEIRIIYLFLVFFGGSNIAGSRPSLEKSSLLKQLRPHSPPQFHARWCFTSLLPRRRPWFYCTMGLNGSLIA